MTMRLPETEKSYQEWKGSGLLPGLHAEPVLFYWQYWRIVDNAAPHDRIAEEDKLVVLNRKSRLDELTYDEWRELFHIMMSLDNRFDATLFNFASMRSVEDIPHLHLYKLKPEFK